MKNSEVIRFGGSAILVGPAALRHRIAPILPGGENKFGSILLKNKEEDNY